MPSSEIENSFKLIQIDRNQSSVIQGYQMIFACVENLHVILSIIRKWNEIESENKIPHITMHPIKNS